MTIDWDKHRNERGFINLIAAFEEMMDGQSMPPHEGMVMANDLLNMLMEIHPIRSRQVAALALTSALQLAETYHVTSGSDQDLFVCGRCGRVSRGYADADKCDGSDPSIVCKKCYNEIVGKQ